MKSYNEFISDIRDAIKDYLPEKYKDSEIIIGQMTKNNNQKTDYITIRGSDHETEPVIYLKEHFLNYQKTGSFEDAIKKIAVLYQEKINSDIIQMDVSDIHTYEKIKNQLVVKIVNFEANQEELSTMPHKKISGTDLAAVFQIAIPFSKDSSASIKVTSDLLSFWNIGLDILYKTALQNTQSHNPFLLDSMEEILFQDPLEEYHSEQKIPTIQPKENVSIDTMLTSDKSLDFKAFLLSADKICPFSEAFAKLFLHPFRIRYAHPWRPFPTFRVRSIGIV